MRRLIYSVYLARRSAWNRRGVLALVVFSIAISTALLIGIERTRAQARESFTQAVYGVDLVVGARGGDAQLIFYAIFHLGGATNNMGYKSAKAIAAREDVAWTIPVSLGDSHKGYPVVATSGAMFERYRFRGDNTLRFANGKPFDDLYDITIGSEAARRLGYALGDSVVLRHGSGAAVLADHSDKPFTVTGILAPTGTPVDRSLFISLEAMEAIHLNWRGGAPIKGFDVAPEQARRFNLEPKSITALLVGLKDRTRVFSLQREIGAYKDEPLSAVMPGVAMDQIWQTLSTGERVLLLVGSLVTVTTLLGLIATISAGLNERRRELAVLRSCGAKPFDIAILLLSEGMILVTIGIATGVAAIDVATLLLGPAILDAYGIAFELGLPRAGEWIIMAAVAAAGVAAGMIPAIRAYRISLSDGLNVDR
ncbi:MAG: ABC transporter permease [Helicobacteraceae bacterium]|nr:ABC transporter permease [Helicobacteraceae bacterium]